MDVQVPKPRKRTSSTASSSQSEVPGSKKKKLVPKGKATAQPVCRPSASTLPLPSPSPPLAPASPLLAPAGGDRPGASAQSVAEPERSATATTKKKPTKLAKNRYLRPQRLSPGSWMTHIASLVVHRCAHQAESCGLDPRGHLSEINWSKMKDGLLGPGDLQMIWYFIRREYPDDNLSAVLDSTKPYSDLTLDKLLREEIRLKYKDEIPKLPLTPYMLFMKSKQPKLKRKHPNLLITEVATKLGRKWSSMGEEKKERYKQQHAVMKTAYEAQLKQFYEEHPDAKPPPKQPAPSKSKRAARGGARSLEAESEEDRILKQLKAQMPKQPISGYLHFCKKKREKLHRKHPELPPNAVTVKLGKRWQTMDEEARRKYVKLHEAGVAQHKEDLAKFHAQHPEAQDLLAKARKTKRKPKVTKQPSPLEEEDEPVTSSSSPLTTALSTLPDPAAEGKGEGQGEEEEEEDEVEVEQKVTLPHASGGGGLQAERSDCSGQNGEGEPEDSDHSDSDSDSSSESSDED